MATTVAHMTKSELREMIETIIEQKLLELLGDPDEGLPLRKSVRDRLLHQKQAVVGGSAANPLKMWRADSDWSKHRVSCPHLGCGDA